MASVSLVDWELLRLQAAGKIGHSCAVLELHTYGTLHSVSMESRLDACATAGEGLVFRGLPLIHTRAHTFPLLGDKNLPVELGVGLG